MAFCFAAFGNWGRGMVRFVLGSATWMPLWVSVCPVRAVSPYIQEGNRRSGRCSRIRMRDQREPVAGVCHDRATVLVVYNTRTTVRRVAVIVYLIVLLVSSSLINAVLTMLWLM